MQRRILLLLSVACVVIAVLAAQTPGDPDWQTAAGGRMAFEVASVRLAKPGTFTLPSVSLGRYIFFAYKLEGFQAMAMQAQLPKWADDNYMIDAKAESNPTKDQMRLMMQSLLADRFKLRGSVAKFIFEPFSRRHDVTKSLEIGHLVKIIKHCLCFEGGFRNGTIRSVWRP
jgi:hypothetical protein